MMITLQIPYKTGIPSQLEILKLERGVSVNGFIVQSIAEKLMQDGYLERTNAENAENAEKSPRPPKRKSIADSIAEIGMKPMRKT